MPDEDNYFGGSLALGFRKWWRHMQTKNSPRSIYQYSNMALRHKLLYLVLFSLYPNLFWELKDKRNLKLYNFDPKAKPMLEYSYIERGLFATIRTIRCSLFNNYWTRSSKISWFVSGELINYLPKPKAEANNWSARRWQITIFCDNRVQ